MNKQTRTLVLVLAAAGAGVLYLAAAPERDEPRKRSAEPETVAAPQDMWCTEIGNCFLDGGDCNRADKGVCTRHSNYACMRFTTVTNRDQILECWKTYGECKTRENAVRRNPEIKSIDTACVIFRKEG